MVVYLLFFWVFVKNTASSLPADNREAVDSLGGLGNQFRIQKTDLN
jgi:hypothetical protein